MASGFAALMAISAAQTREAQSAVQTALQERQRKEELRRKQQEERERKEREMEAKMRLKHFEEEKKEQERLRRREQEKAVLEQALQRREEEQRDALRYGPKKAPAKWPSSASQLQTREEIRRRRFPDDDDDDDSPSGMALTREEKRERKLQAELRRTFNNAKRSTQTGGYIKAGRRLPGGAVDVTTTTASADASSPTKSVKERIAAMPNTLTKLNVVKRDTRTIDEILQDRAKARETKVLDGDSAREFNDWFVTKKKEPVKKPASISGPTSAPGSGTNTPASQGSIPLSTSAQAAKTIVAPKPSAPTPLKTPSKSASNMSKAAATISRPSTADKHLSTKSSASNLVSKPSKATLSVSAAHSSVNSRLAPIKKRPRSSSLSSTPSPPPAKKRSATPVDDICNYKDEIWKLFGKSRDVYTSRNVFSDDEDMEAGASDLEKEEKYSARLAKREDELALEEERRHEEEKRRRRKEKEPREKRR